MHFGKYSVRRNRAGVGSDNGVLADDFFHHCEYLLLERNVFRGGLDNQFAVFNLLIVRGVDNVFPDNRSFFRFHFFAVDRFLSVADNSLFSFF